MGNGRRIGHIRTGQQVEPARERHGGKDTAVGRALRLDDVRRAAGLAGRAGVEGVVAATAYQGVDPAAAAQDVGIAVAGQDVVEGGAPDFLDPRQGVVTGTARGGSRRQADGDRSPGPAVVGNIPAVAAVERIIAEAADQGVVAVAATDVVVARAAIEIVIAGKPVEGVIATQAADRIGKGRAGDGFAGNVTRHRDPAGRSRCDGGVGKGEEFDIGQGDGCPAADDRADLSGPGDRIG